MAEHKILSRSAARRWRQQVDGEVVFTNGVFDLLHPGHVELLERARAMGAALVVGVNDDDSARNLAKGPDRPINPASARAAVLAGLAAVDCVVLFSEGTPEELVRELVPDVLVKGADYALEEIPGRDIVESSGGRVVRIPLREGYSTTGIVERIRGES